MLDIRYTKLRVSDNENLYRSFTNFLNRDFFDFFTAKYLDKELEVNLCKTFFQNCKSFATPESLEQEFNEIDVFVDGVPVQVKCRSKSNLLILEDYKLNGYNEKTSWVDRNQSYYTLFCSSPYAGCIEFRLFDSRELKELLKVLREKQFKGISPSTTVCKRLDLQYKFWKDYNYIEFKRSAIFEIPLN